MIDEYCVTGYFHLQVTEIHVVETGSNCIFHGKLCQVGLGALSKSIFQIDRMSRAEVIKQTNTATNFHLIVQCFAWSCQLVGSLFGLILIENNPHLSQPGRDKRCNFNGNRRSSW